MRIYLKTKIDHVNQLEFYWLKLVYVPSNQFTIILIHISLK